VLRALLIANDDFVTQADTSPSSYNNVISLRQALLRDRRGYGSIKVSLNEKMDANRFGALARDAFRGAREGDVSLLYLSTHGLRMEGSDDFFALMSDGETESLLSGEDIYIALKDIPGKKVLILDACYSGAAIRKGLDTPLVSSPFTGPDFKVLTSAGGGEPSFLWTDALGTVRGGSYFAQAMAEGLAPYGRAAADENRDGSITLSELHAYQTRNYGASSPQVYPENDGFVLFEYDLDKSAAATPLFSGLSFDTRVIRRKDDLLRFAYTLHQPARLAYQLVYAQEGAWRFQAPQSIPEDGILSPGRRDAALQLLPGLSGLSGYVLLFILSVDEDQSQPLACVLLSVQTGDEEPKPRVDSAASFVPDIGEEAAFILRHKGPITITAVIRDAQGLSVARLAHETLSRPLHLTNEGTNLYWNGRDDSGEPAMPGLYQLDIRVMAGTRVYQVKSGMIELKPPAEPAQQ
jgi:hypothetical protein